MTRRETRRRRSRPVSSLGLAGILALVACDAQTDPDALEEPVARLDAVVDPSARLSPDELAGLAWRIVWVNFLGGRIQRYMDPLGARGAFPNRFELEVMGAPAARFLNDMGAISQGALEADIGVAVIESSAPGTYSRQLLVYVAGEIAPRSVSARFLGGPIEPGLHLFDAVQPPCETYLEPGDPAHGMLDCLRPAAGDLDGLIELRGAGDEPFPPPDYPAFFANPACDPPWEPCGR